jgi:hypothetical protein
MRLVICGLIGVLCACFSYGAAKGIRLHRDLGQSWFAAKVLLAGGDPYAAIGPGQAFEWPAPYFYPLSAAVAAIPLTPFSEAVASALFALVAGVGLAWALSEHGYGPLLAITSTCVWQAFLVVQWSPLMAVGLVLSPFAFVWAAKPTIGAALFFARPTWWAVAGGVILFGVAFALRPSWPMAWREALQGASLEAAKGFPYVAPVTRPGGVLALAAILRWRRPEARLIFAMSLVPQTLVPYEALALFLVPRGWWQTALLVALSYVIWWWVLSHGPYTDYARPIDINGRAITLLLYLPATAMVLFRPNEGRVPRAIERLVTRWPPWLRGYPPPSRAGAFPA